MYIYKSVIISIHITTSHTHTHTHTRTHRLIANVATKLDVTFNHICGLVMSQDEVKVKSNEPVGTAYTANVWLQFQNLQRHIECYHSTKKHLFRVINSRKWYQEFRNARLEVRRDNQGHVLSMTAKQQVDAIRLFHMAVNLDVYSLAYCSRNVAAFDPITMEVTLSCACNDITMQAKLRDIQGALISCYTVRQTQRLVETGEMSIAIEGVSSSTVRLLRSLGMPQDVAERVCRRSGKKCASVQMAADVNKDRCNISTGAWIKLLVKEVMLLYAGDDIQVRQTLTGGLRFVYSPELQHKQSLYKQEDDAACRKDKADRDAAYHKAKEIADAATAERRQSEQEVLDKHKDHMRKNDLRRWADFINCTPPNPWRGEIVCATIGCPMAVARGAPNVCFACCMWWMRVNNVPLTAEFVDKISHHAAPGMKR
jgi:hypothetical protein